jgi:two-component system nitrate/nitrite response regulator NarL
MRTVDERSTSARDPDMTQVIRVVLAEPRRLIRDALRALLEAHAITVVGDVKGTSDLLPVIEQQQPQVVLITLDGWGDGDVALLQNLPKVAERVPTLVLMAEFDNDVHAHVIELGIMGCVVKTQPGELLVKAILKVSAGELWLDRARTATVLSHLTRKRVRLDDDPDAMRVESLTPRERQIVALVTEGMKNRDLADRLSISQATARNHMTSILDKLGVSDRFELAVYAFRRGLVPCPQTPAKLLSAKMLSADSDASARTVRAVRPAAQRHVVRAR